VKEELEGVEPVRLVKVELPVKVEVVSLPLLSLVPG
jgi:hypothetical protein